jgi:hypothetical protein
MFRKSHIRYCRLGRSLELVHLLGFASLFMVSFRRFLHFSARIDAVINIRTIDRTIDVKFWEDGNLSRCDSYYLIRNWAKGRLKVSHLSSTAFRASPPVGPFFRVRSNFEDACLILLGGSNSRMASVWIGICFVKIIPTRVCATSLILNRPQPGLLDHKIKLNFGRKIAKRTWNFVAPTRSRRDIRSGSRWWPIIYEEEDGD